MSFQPWCAAAVALVALSVADSAAAEMCVEVQVRFAGLSPPAPVVRAMREDAASIWKSYGLRIQWSQAPRPRCGQVQGSFDVVVHRGPLRPRRPGEIVLGRTRLAAAAIAGAPVCLDYDAIARLLGSVQVSQFTLLAGHADIGPTDMGRALGRVLAHEIGHVILGVSAHQRRGLMRASFFPEELVAPQRSAFTLSRREVDRLRQRERALEANRPAGAAQPSM